MSQGLDRRGFLRALAAALLAAPSACGGEDDDEGILAARVAAERARAQSSALRFRGYRGLADLPEFELGSDGELQLAEPGVPAGIDIHTHLGINLLLAPEIDLRRRTERVEYFLDCDAPAAPCEIDLDVYMNDNFTPALRRRLLGEQLRQLVLGSHAAATHTAANLVAELDRLGLAQAAVLPIAFGLPFGDDLGARWLDQLERSPLAERLVFGASVHPRDADWREKLRTAAARGARILKLHPEFQRFFPDDPAALELYAECERLDLPVLFHAGRSAIEPRFLRKYALLRRYAGAVEAFPRVRFVLGHAGARDLPEAVPLAQRAPNVWLDTSSISLSALSDAHRALGPERLAFGSDWPFYAVASALAKVLILTRGDPGARREILRGSAERILRPADPASRQKPDPQSGPAS